MAGMVVTASTGVMKPLLEKLATLMGDEYKKLKGVRNQVSFLRDELTTMNAFLEKLALMDDELDPLAKDWRNYVREMAYDIEDCIDDFIMHHLDGAEEGLVHKITNYVKNLRERYRIANQVDELKARVAEANDRRKRYKLDDSYRSSSSASVTTVDPRISALFTEAASLVGIDGPREELLEWLTDPGQQLKVVSIVGFGGLGKTTLAKQVYDKIGEPYRCKAFVSVSQRPDMTSLLKSIGSKLGVKVSSEACKVQDIIDEIRDYLKHKRYFVVVDDLWDQTSWNTISWCFPENGNGCRVIVTTRVEDVATSACRNHQHIHRMKPLNRQDSARLFFSRIFGSEDGCPQFKHVSAEILERCGGLPLAIITIASLLASRRTKLRQEWESIRNSLGCQFGINATLDGMRQILDLSYKNLPHHLRTCLLYLGMYPEDHEIRRDDLVRRWIAEGFVSNSHGRDLEDVGESYFNELVNRSLVQAVPDEHYGEVLSCRVHDMMLDLILRRCEEDNFIGVAYGTEDVARLPAGDWKVRRLSVLSSVSAGNGAVHGTTEAGIVPPAGVSHVRSLVLFGSESMHMLPLMPFKHLRVLDIYMQVPFMFNKRVDVTAIGQMFQLRYVKVIVFRSYIELPSKIGGLVHLETLDIDGREPVSIPADIVSLPRLRHLAVSDGIRLPERICDIKSLRTLQGMHMLDMDAKGFGELTNLRDLLLYSVNHSLTPAAGNYSDALGSVLGKLRNLRRLHVDSWGSEEDGGRLASLSDPPPHIEVLVLPTKWRFSRVPRWINGGDLHSLRILTLSVAETSADEVRLLGELPSLFRLRLHVLRSPTVAVGAGLFPALEYLDLRGGEDVASFLGFLPGTMPKLRRLEMRFGEWEWGGVTPVGMEHLLSLQKISVFMDYHLRDGDARLRGPECSHAGRAFSNAAQAHPSRPAFTITSTPLYTPPYPRR